MFKIFAFIIPMFCNCYLVSEEQLGLYAENNQIIGWEQRETEYFNDFAAIAGEIHGE